MGANSAIEWTATRWVEDEISTYRLGECGSHYEWRPGETRGPFGIHERGPGEGSHGTVPVERWILTHLPTGLAMHAFPKRRQAKDAVDLLVAETGEAPWGALDTTDVPDDLRRAFHRAVLAVDRYGALKRWPALEEVPAVRGGGG